MLIAFGGLPGSGKTTLARELAKRLSATYLRIDTLEQAIVASRALADVGPVGYFIAYAVAADNLKLGLTVIADSVNSLTVTRDAWRDAAKLAEVPFVEIEVICSDVIEHRRRVESRQPDIPGHRLPTWQDVLHRRYDSWDREHLIIDTATLTSTQIVDDFVERISLISRQASPSEF